MPATTEPSFPVSKRIMVVDDDEAVREMLVRVLRGAGHFTFSAASGSEALRGMSAYGCDLVLLDIGMAEQDGWTTLAQLRRKAPGLPAIIITAWPDQQSAARAAGAAACLEKPLDFPTLLKAVSEALDTPSSFATRAANEP